MQTSMPSQLDSSAFIMNISIKDSCLCLEKSVNRGMCENLPKCQRKYFLCSEIHNIKTFSSGYGTS